MFSCIGKYSQDEAEIGTVTNNWDIVSPGLTLSFPSRILWMSSICFTLQEGQHGCSCLHSTPTGLPSKSLRSLCGFRDRKHTRIWVWIPSSVTYWPVNLDKSADFWLLWASFLIYKRVILGINVTKYRKCLMDMTNTWYVLNPLL